MIQRQMYGRAGFELLRARVLQCGASAAFGGPAHELHQKCGRAILALAVTCV